MPKYTVLGSNPMMFNKQVTEGKYTPLFIRNFVNFFLLQKNYESNSFLSFTSSDKKLYLFPLLLKYFYNDDEMAPVRNIKKIENGYLLNINCGKKIGHKFHRLNTIDIKSWNTQKLYFLKTIKLLLKEKVQVLLAHPPLSHSYLNYPESDPIFLKFKATINQIANNQNLSISNQDYQSFSMDLNDKDFLNEKHLCYSGVIKFSNAFSDFFKSNYINLQN